MTPAGERRKFRRTVWNYYKKHGRHELPWRAPSLRLRRPEVNLDPYAILVSEVMLQQTQVERVIPKFKVWLKLFPNFSALANASVADVLQVWQGLGYNRRALALQRCAQRVLVEYDGELPKSESELVALPGIGPYTAGAVRAFAFNQPVVMLETNIRTVFLHHFYPEQQNISDDALVPHVETTLDKKRPREWYWALMDYGSYLKKQHGNPNRRSRHYVRQSEFEGSDRQLRGAIIRALIQKPSFTENALITYLLKQEGLEVSRVASLLSVLEREGFITRYGQRVRITPITTRLTK